jgi:hypothetical protein
MSSVVRPTVYLETTIPSDLTARPSRDLVTAARQEITREWWENRRADYDLVLSQVVLDESARGHPDAAYRRLAALDGLPVLGATQEMRTFAEGLIEAGLIPVEAADDAAHIAIETLSGIKYLLTWNFRHIANADVKEEIRAFCLRAG